MSEEEVLIVDFIPVMAAAADRDGPLCCLCCCDGAVHYRYQIWWGIGAVLQAVETTPVTVTEKVSKISDGDVENIKPSVLFVSQKNLLYNKHCHNYQSAHCVQAFQMLRQLAAGCYRTVRS